MPYILHKSFIFPPTCLSLSLSLYIYIYIYIIYYILYNSPPPPPSDLLNHWSKEASRITILKDASSLDPNFMAPSATSPSLAFESDKFFEEVRRFTVMLLYDMIC